MKNWETDKDEEIRKGAHTSWELQITFTKYH